MTQHFIKHKKTLGIIALSVNGLLGVWALCPLGYGDVKNWIMGLAQQCVISLEQFTRWLMYYDVLGTVVAWVILACGVASLLWVCSLTIGRNIYLQKTLFVKRKIYTSQEQYPCHVYEVKDPRVFAFTAGLLRPCVYLSSRLINQVSPQALQAIIAHELSHVRNYDSLKALGIAMVRAALFFVPCVRVWADMHLMKCELRSDRDAKNQFGELALAQAWVGCCGAQQPYVGGMYFSYINQRVQGGTLKNNNVTSLFFSGVIMVVMLWGLVMPWVGYGASDALSFRQVIESGALVQSHCASGELLDTQMIRQSFQMTPITY